MGFFPGLFLQKNALNGEIGGAVQVATGGQVLPEGGRQSLDGRQGGRVGEDMLHEEESPLRLERPSDLSETCREVVDGAEDEGDDDAVE